jgi:hypothetical protein
MLGSSINVIKLNIPDLSSRLTVESGNRRKLGSSINVIKLNIPDLSSRLTVESGNRRKMYRFTIAPPLKVRIFKWY